MAGVGDAASTSWTRDLPIKTQLPLGHAQQIQSAQPNPRGKTPLVASRWHLSGTGRRFY